jgi:hypothetical protein
MKLGVVLALDLGVRTGYCHGARGMPPTSGSVRLKTKDERASLGFCQLTRFLSEQLGTLKPSLVVKEAALPLQAFANLGNSARVVRFTFGLHAIVEAMCELHRIEWRDVADSTARKHFLGQGRMGSRDETKRRVIQGAIMRGWVPATCEDDNRADACAVWDWAAHTPPNKLFLLGEEAA